MAIHFHSLKIEFDLQNKNLHKAWIRSCVSAHERVTGSINFIFTSNPSLRDMNREYLYHDCFTDVITFDYSEEDHISGDVFISVDQVRINAESYSESFDDELRRVMVHGVLHLIAYNDASEAEKKVMRKLENDALHLWLKEE
ncbi:MAG: rRNA maturation RNase YbeY [Bacteroidetes bacterium]|nr:rRNA maturation RNase YbeY [Bacteroidota bacterium]